MTPKQLEEIKKEFKKGYLKYHQDNIYPDEIDKLIDNALLPIQSDVARECYLQCLAVECGEGECSQAIAEKFPELVSRLDEDNRFDLKITNYKLKGGRWTKNKH